LGKAKGASRSPPSRALSNLNGGGGSKEDAWNCGASASARLRSSAERAILKAKKRREDVYGDRLRKRKISGCKGGLGKRCIGKDTISDKGEVPPVVDEKKDPISDLVQEARDSPPKKKFFGSS